MAIKKTLRFIPWEINLRVSLSKFATKAGYYPWWRLWFHKGKLLPLIYGII